MEEYSNKVKSKVSEDWVSSIKKGATLLHPTDTIWGLAAAVFSRKGVESIYRLKGKPQTDPLILLVADFKMLQQYVLNIPPRIETLLDYVERPLTLIYPKVSMLPEYLIHEDGSVAFRITHKKELSDLIRSLNQPIISTSANMYQEAYATSYFEIDERLKENVDLIYYPPYELELEFNQPSVIASFDENGELYFIRT